jgi:hypothetical protein
MAVEQTSLACSFGDLSAFVERSFFANNLLCECEQCMLLHYVIPARLARISEWHIYWPYRATLDLPG